MSEARDNLTTALREWATYRKSVPGARTSAGDDLAAAARAVLAELRMWSHSMVSEDER